MKNQTNKNAKRWQSARWTCAFAAISSIALLSTACGDSTEGVAKDPGPIVQSKEFALLPAPNCDVVRDRLIDANTEQTLDNLYNSYRWGSDDMAGGVPEASPGDAADDGAPDDYTETNVQEAGVDEPDIIKTDGKFIYTTRGNELLIIKSWPANETTIVGRHSLG